MSRHSLARCSIAFAAVGFFAVLNVVGSARFYYKDITPGGYYNGHADAWAINNNSLILGSGGPEPDVFEPFMTELDSNTFTPLSASNVSIATFGALNDAGQFAAVANFYDGSEWSLELVRHSPGVGYEILGSLDGYSGIVYDMNAGGSIVGFWMVQGDSNGTRAFVYTDAGGLQDIGTLGGDTSVAVDINDAGQVVGHSTTGSSATFGRAFFWQDGVTTPIGPENRWSCAVGINNAGVAIGNYLDGYTWRPFSWTVDGGLNLQPLPPEAFASYLVAINESGQIAGDGLYGAFVYTPGAGIAWIGDVSIVGMNNRGHVIAHKVVPPYAHVGMYWAPETGLDQLDDVIFPPLHFDIQQCVAINDHDEILVTGVYDDQFVASAVFPTEKGDLDCDSRVDFDDIDPFVAALQGRDHYDAAYPNCNWPSADLNDDGLVNFGDVDPFVALLTAQ